MKTTKQIHQIYEMNNESERNISLDKWYSEEEIINAIDKVLEIDDYEESMYNRLLKKELFGDEK